MPFTAGSSRRFNAHRVKFRDLRRGPGNFDELARAWFFDVAVVSGGVTVAPAAFLSTTTYPTSTTTGGAVFLPASYQATTNKPSAALLAGAIVSPSTTTGTTTLFAATSSAGATVSASTHQHALTFYDPTVFGFVPMNVTENSHVRRKRRQHAHARR